MDLHRAFAAEFGIGQEALETERPDRETRAYPDFLVRVAATGDFAELAAALLPCMWGYAEVGRRLDARATAGGALCAVGGDVRVRGLRSDRELVPRARRPTGGGCGRGRPRAIGPWSRPSLRVVDMSGAVEPSSR
jgi:hypothetical protein